MSEENQISKMTDEVIVYQSADNAVRLDVRVSGETVWLTQQQMTVLFGHGAKHQYAHSQHLQRRRVGKGGNC